MEVNNGFIIQSYKNGWGSSGGVSINAGKSGQKTLNWPISWPHGNSVCWVGVVNHPGITVSTSSLTATQVTFTMYNCTTSTTTVERCNMIAIGY